MAKKTSKKLPKPDKGQLALFKGVESMAPEGDESEVRERATTAMVRADERAIVAGAEGQMAVGWVYQYSQGNQTVTGISYPGFRELYRRVYKMDRLIWTQFPTVTVEKDDPRGPTLVAYGVICNPKHPKESWPVFAEEPLMKWRSEGSPRPNHHARAVVMGKFLRNAMKMVCPDRQAAIFLGHCLSQKAPVARLGAGGGEDKMSSTKRAQINQLLSMARGYGLNINDAVRKKQLFEFLARQFKIRLSAMTDTQVGSVVQWLRESVEKHGKDAFVVGVESVSIVAD